MILLSTSQAFLLHQIWNDKNKIKLKEFFEVFYFYIAVQFILYMSFLILFEKVFEKKFPSYNFSISFLYLGNWIFCFLINKIFVSPNTSIKFNLLDRFRVYSVIGVFLLVIGSLLSVQINGSEKEKESPILFTLAKPARFALQKLNRGSVERPILINNETCQKFKEIIWGNSKQCSNHNCFIGTVLLDLDNQYIRTDKGYTLELDSSVSTIIQNESYNELLDKDQKGFCQNYERK